MIFDVIYINFNSTGCLIKSIESLFKENQANLKLNVIVVDNFSGDDPRKLKALFPEIALILNKKNRGFGAAINQVLTYCRSNYIILLNPDSLVSNGFLENSLTFMEKNSGIGMMGPMIVNEDGSIQGSARAFPTPLTALFGRNSPLTKIFPNNAITRSNVLNLQNPTMPKEVDWVSGACMVIRRKAMHAVNGFDERFFLYWEDTDLCQRIRTAGWKVIYNPEPIITHLVGKSSKTRPIFASYQFHKSSHLLFDKYAKWPFNLFTPLAGIALMLRFSLGVMLNIFSNILTNTKEAKD